MDPILLPTLVWKSRTGGQLFCTFCSTGSGPRPPTHVVVTVSLGEIAEGVGGAPRAFYIVAPQEQDGTVRFFGKGEFGQQIRFLQAPNPSLERNLGHFYEPSLGQVAQIWL